MWGSRQLLRTGISAAMGLALMLPSTTGTAAPGGASGFNPNNLPARVRARLSGLADLALRSDAPGGATSTPTRPVNFFPRQDECGVNRGGNTKVNQNCLNVADPDLQGRGQAQNETAIAVDPNNPRHVISGYNDYRRGDGTCGTSYSLDGGRTWNDSTTPNGFSRGNAGNIQVDGVQNAGTFGTPREYWQGGGDPSVAWDSRGNAYYACQVFNRGKPTSPNPDMSSGFLLFRSVQNDGASWDFPGRAVIVNDDTAGTGAFFEDKQYMTVDNSATSRFRDRIYVTWTEFGLNDAGLIYSSFSNDYGDTFSPKHLLSPTTANSLCPVAFKSGCDSNQFSQPFTAPDGTLYVVWANYNLTSVQPGQDGPEDPGADQDANGAARTTAATPGDNRNQILLVKSTDGGVSFSSPVRVGDFYELPDCATYQAGADIGRACVPEKGSNTNSVFRASNYPSGGVNPRTPSQIVVSYASYISQTSNETNGCVPQGFSPDTALPRYAGVKTAGACNNKIVVSLSTNGGTSFTGATADVRTLPVATGLRSQAKTDQWFQWLSFTPRGKLVIANYDRAFGDDETSGNSDFTVSGTSDLSAFAFDTRRVTANSMPLPTQFPDGNGNSQFWGDYAGLAAGGDTAFPLWSDTRDQDVFNCPGTPAAGIPPSLCGGTEPNGLTANDQDIFVDAVDAPGR